MDIVKFETLENKILKIRDEKVLLDSDVAELYGVETKRVNEAVKNNRDKFPNGYLFELTREELEILRSKFSTTKFSKTRTLPKAFTERGLYMLATVLKSKNALEATFAIIETTTKFEFNLGFAKVSRSVKKIKK